MRLCLMILVLLTLFVAIASNPPAESTPFCFIVDLQQCVPCGPDLAKTCIYYECDDGSSRVSCTECSLFCQES